MALDISMVEMQGLRTADWWFEEHGIYFERVLAQMSALPFAEDSFDWVFCCEVLHHNDRRGMIAALREIHRVLRPGGSLLVMNEPLRWPTDLKLDHGLEVAQFAGNEHVYFFLEYLSMAFHAGFHRIRVTEPAFDIFFSREPIHLTSEASALGSFNSRLPSRSPASLRASPAHVVALPHGTRRVAADDLHEEPGLRICVSETIHAR